MSCLMWSLHCTTLKNGRGERERIIFSSQQRVKRAKETSKKNCTKVFEDFMSLGKVSVSIFTRAFRVLIEHYPIRHAVNANWLSMIRHIFMVFVLPWDFVTGLNHRLNKVRDEYQETHWDFLFLGFVVFSMKCYGIWHEFWCHFKWEQEKENQPSLDFGENEGEYLLLLDRYGLFSMDPFLIDHLCAFRLPKKG